MIDRQRVSAAELEMLRYISEHHPVTVREVAEAFSESPGRARTTVLTLMERLRKKGYLARTKVSGVNQYSPCEPKADLLQDLVRDFVQRALGGSVAPFVAYLGNDVSLSEDELAELKRLVHKLDEQERTAQTPEVQQEEQP